MEGEKKMEGIIKDTVFKEINKHDAQKLIAVILLTDGSVKWNKSHQSFVITLHNKDENLHELFKRLLWIGFNEKPTFDRLFDKGVFNTGIVRVKNREIVNILFSKDSSRCHIYIPLNKITENQFDNHFLSKKDCKEKFEKICIQRIVDLSKAIGGL